MEVVIYAYHFPPEISAGSQRPSRMAQMLVHAGHSVTVYSREIDSRDDIDHSQSIENNKVVNVIRVADPFTKLSVRMPKIFQKVLRFLAIPDGSIFHVFRVSKLLRSKNIDLLLTTSAPQSAHLLPMLLGQKKVLWLADIRDSLSENPSYATKLIKPMQFLFAKVIERLVDNKADLVLTVSRTIQRQYKIAKTQVFYNGFEDELLMKSHSVSSEKFIVGFIGSLYAERDPDIFISGFNLFFSQIKDSEKSNVEIMFIGNSHPQKIKKLTKISNNCRVVIHNYIEKEKLMEIAGQWSVSLLLVDAVLHSEGVLTGKLFDYLCLDAEILAIVPSNSEVREIISTTKSGVCCTPRDDVEISEALLNMYERWLEQRSFDTPIYKNSDEIMKYARSSQSVMLKELIEQLCP